MTLKAAFLQPLGGELPTALATDLFGRTDTDFMALFVGGCCLAGCMSESRCPRSPLRKYFLRQLVKASRGPQLALHLRGKACVHIAVGRRACQSCEQCNAANLL